MRSLNALRHDALPTRSGALAEQTGADQVVARVAVACDEVWRRYRSGSQNVVALAGASLEVRPGEVVAITGPSGSGKTTLLNLIAGLDHPDDGQITVLGHRLGGASERELTDLRAKTIGFVFQDPHLLAGLSARENVIVAGLPRGRRNTLAHEADELLAAVGMGERMDFPPARLSGGERQRVAIARALLGGRPILLADEPTGNLDARTSDEVMGLIDRLREERELTVIVATHDPAVASYADRVLLLRDGLLQEAPSAPPGRIEVHRLEDA
jgi:putative ABC transport system ATP-binding protein